MTKTLKAITALHVIQSLVPDKTDMVFNSNVANVKYANLIVSLNSILTVLYRKDKKKFTQGVFIASAIVKEVNEEMKHEDDFEFYTVLSALNVLSDFEDEIMLLKKTTKFMINFSDISFLVDHLINVTTADKEVSKLVSNSSNMDLRLTDKINNAEVHKGK